MKNFLVALAGNSARLIIEGSTDWSPGVDSEELLLTSTKSTRILFEKAERVDQDENKWARWKFLMANIHLTTGHRVAGLGKRPEDIMGKDGHELALHGVQSSGGEAGYTQYDRSCLYTVYAHETFEESVSRKQDEYFFQFFSLRSSKFQQLWFIGLEGPRTHSIEACVTEGNIGKYKTASSEESRVASVRENVERAR